MRLAISKRTARDTSWRRPQPLSTSISQEKFAEEAELHRTYVSDLERGTLNPTIRVVEKLAKALKVQLGQLLD